MRLKRDVLRAGSLTGAAGSALGSAAASICCIGPLGLSLLGVQGAIFAAGLKPYRVYLLVGSALLLAFAFWSVYRPRRLPNGSACSIGVGRLTRAVLWGSLGIWLIAVVLQFMAQRLWL